MKKKLFLLVFIFLLSSISGCKLVEETPDYEMKRSQLIECLSNELEAHIVSDKLEAHELPIKDIFAKIPEYMTYYEGKYSSEDNRYVIFASSPEVADNIIERYFSSRYKEYYMYNIGVEGISIYFHNHLNEIDFEEIKDKCIHKTEEENPKKIPTSSLKKVNNTSKIIIKQGNKEIGTIKNKKSIKKVLDALSSSYTSSRKDVAYLCDGHAFNFELYTGNKKVDTMYLWGGGLRVNLESIERGCIYYTLGDRSLNLNHLIEEETDYIFYTIFDISNEEGKTKNVLVAEDDKYNYYYEGSNAEDLFITFSLTGRTKSLISAIEDKDITLKQLENNKILDKKSKK